MEKQQIFPSFRRQNKWLGIIDYKSLIIFGIYLYLIYIICIALNLPTKIVLSIIIIATVPLFAIYISNDKEESIVDIMLVVLRFYLSNKKYYYKIERREEFDINITRKKRPKLNIDKLFELLSI